MQLNSLGMPPRLKQQMSTDFFFHPLHVGHGFVDAQVFFFGFFVEFVLYKNHNLETISQVGHFTVQISKSSQNTHYFP